jgi:hypothetical protein
MIRNLKKGEVLTGKLATGYEGGEATDPQWIFVAERDGKPVAVLVTAPAHIVVIFLRLVSDGAAPTDVRSLLIYALASARERGYSGYITWVDEDDEAGKALMDIVLKADGFSLPNKHIVCGGRV